MKQDQFIIIQIIKTQRHEDTKKEINPLRSLRETIKSQAEAQRKKHAKGAKFFWENKPFRTIMKVKHQAFAT